MFPHAVRLPMLAATAAISLMVTPSLASAAESAQLQLESVNVPTTSASRDITVTPVIRALDGATCTGMRVANEDGNWPSAGAFNLPCAPLTHRLSAGDGAKGVFVQLRGTSAGKTIESNIVYVKTRKTADVAQPAAVAAPAATVAPAMTIAQPASDTDAPMAQADRDAINKIMAELVRAGAGTGAVSVTGPKGRHDYAIGATSVDHHFRIGSVTKTFTALAVLIQVDRGVIKLDDPLEKYVPGVRNGNLMTVRNLLAQRTGVYHYDTTSQFQMGAILSPTAAYTPATALAAIKTGASSATPGTKFEYANSNYVLLGEVLRAATGKTPQQVITDDVIKPLGLTETSFPADNNVNMPAPATRGYYYFCLIPGWTFTCSWRDITAQTPGRTGAAGAMVSTVRDLTKYAKAMANGALLKPETTQMRRTMFCGSPASSAYGPKQFGYGLGLISYGAWLGHPGGVPGYTTASLFNPTTGATITVMENRMSTNLQAWDTAAMRIAKHLYPETMTAAAAPAYETC